MARSEGGGGRRRQSNDSDDEESMRTPPRAQYGSGAPARLSSECLFPPLPQNAGVAALAERFRQVFAGLDLPAPAHVEHFKGIETGLKLRQHMRDHGLLKESDAAGGGALRPIIVEQRPAFDQVMFFAGPAPAADQDDDGTALERRLRFWSVQSATAASLMKQRGYKLIHVTHLPNNMSQLPPPVDEITRGPRAGRQQEAPEELIVPSRCKDFEQRADAPTVAAQLVDMFEVKVAMDADGAGGRPKV